MEFFLIIVCRATALIIDAVSLFMLLRALLPLFRVTEDSRFYSFLIAATEPFIIPVRFILYKLNVLQDSMLDWSFTFTYLLLAFVRMILPAV